MNIDRSQSGKNDMRRLNPRGGVPTFDIDGQVVTGFSESSLERTIDGAARRRAKAP